MKKKKAKAKKPAKKKAKVKAKAKPKVKKSSKKSKGKRPKAKAKKKAVAAVPKPGVIAPVNGVLLGFVEDYFAKVGVVALTLKASVAVGQRIQVLGHTTNIEQVVDSMQIERVPVSQATAKDGVGIKVKDRARCGDHVYLLK